MLDIRYIIEHQDEVEKAIKAKNIDLSLSDLVSIHKKKTEVQQEIEELNRQRNENANRMKGQVGKPPEGLIIEGKRIKSELETREPKLKQLHEKFTELMLRVPNIFSDDTPIGNDESSNRELRTHGTPKKFTFPIKDHVELGLQNNLLDVERGAKVSGFRGYFLKNELALIHWGLMQLAIKKMVDKGFQVMVTPTMVREPALIGSGHFPAGQDEIYPVRENADSETKYLAGTSEPALLAYRSDEIIEDGELPLKYCGVSPCYRREVGSYGKDTKGIYRVHEFFKVEQVVICRADMKEAMSFFDSMLAIAEELLQDLNLPYRVLSICTGDMGAGKYKMHDIETWMPSRNTYGETHSLSFLTDWQSRRLNIRYKTADGKSIYPYTLNNTVVASPRILIAILENYQREDGSIEVPKVLRDFVGKKTIG